MARKLTVEMKVKSGAIDRFYLWVDGKRRVAADASAPRVWSGKVADEGTRVTAMAVGRGKAKFALAIDLPGTLHDQQLELVLDQGVRVFKCSL